MMAGDTRWITDDMGIIDLMFQGVPRVIASYVFKTDSGVALIEVGPSSTIPTLLEGLKALGVDESDVRRLLVTHIHLDHMGSAGTLLDRWPNVSLVVHEVGAPHAIDPTNLIRSATRIYGDQMGPLWGEMRPIPADRVRAVSGGETLDVDGRQLLVTYTPGHASHHVAYRDEGSGFVVTGDVAGIRIPPSTLIIPPTPPPDIDIPLWHASISAVRAMEPAGLLLTHFGPVTDVDPHLNTLEQVLDDWVVNIETLLASGAERDAIVAWLENRVRARLGTDIDSGVNDALSLASPFGMAVDGLLRYLRKRDERAQVAR